MGDTRSFQQVREATDHIAVSLHDTNQAMVDSLTALQDSNLKFTRNSFLNWMDLLAQQSESMQRMQHLWEQQVRAQQGVFLELMSSSIQISMNIFLAPFSLTRRGVDATEDMLRREREQVGSAP